MSPILADGVADLGIRALIVGLGGYSVYVGVFRYTEQSRQRERSAAYWPVRLVSRLPLQVARVVWVLMGVGIIALGVLAR